MYKISTIFSGSLNFNNNCKNWEECVMNLKNKAVTALCTLSLLGTGGIVANAASLDEVKASLSTAQMTLKDGSELKLDAELQKKVSKFLEDAELTSDELDIVVEVISDIQEELNSGNFSSGDEVLKSAAMKEFFKEEIVDLKDNIDGLEIALGDDFSVVAKKGNATLSVSSPLKNDEPTTDLTEPDKPSTTVEEKADDDDNIIKATGMNISFDGIAVAGILTFLSAAAAAVYAYKKRMFEGK